MVFFDVIIPVFAISVSIFFLFLCLVYLNDGKEKIVFFLNDKIGILQNWDRENLASTFNTMYVPKNKNLMFTESGKKNQTALK